jgi:hypothetical protein
MPIFFAFLHLINTVTFIPLAIFAFWPWPSSTYSLNGKDLNYSEFWLSGLAPFMLLGILAISYLCVATSLKYNWSKFGVFLYWSVIIGLLSFYSVTGVIVGISIILLWAFYIFKNAKLIVFYRAESA